VCRVEEEGGVNEDERDQPVVVSETVSQLESDCVYCVLMCL